MDTISHKSAKIEGHHPHLVNLVSRIVGAQTDWWSSDMIEGLACLSTFCPDELNTNRMTVLRTEIEKQKVLAQEEAFKEFEKVEVQIEELDNLVHDLQAACETASNDLKQCQQSTRFILDKANNLREKRHVVRCKRQLCDFMVAQFTLSPDSIRVLTDELLPVDQKFFSALEELYSVRDTANRLLSASCRDAKPLNGDISPPSEGLPPPSSPDSNLATNAPSEGSVAVDVLQYTSEILERTYERLFHWVQTHYRGLPNSISLLPDKEIQPNDITEEGFPITNQPTETFYIKRALAALSKRPIYFIQCVEDIVKMRRFVVLQSFHAALTRGGPNGNPRPIEMHAFDPTRYVSDMLAWIHQHSASEYEFIMSLLEFSTSPLDSHSNSAGPHSDPTIQQTRSDNFGEHSAQQLLDAAFEGLCQPFVIRVEQAIASRPPVVTVFKIYQLLDFYALTFDAMFRKHGTSSDTTHIATKPCLVRVCLELREKAHTAFMRVWQDQAVKLSSLPSSAVFTADLAAPQFVVETVNTLSEVLQLFSKSLTSKDSGEDDFSLILDSALDPMLNFCRQAASSLPPTDSAVYLINCFAYAQQSFRKYDLISRRVEMLAGLIDEQLTILTDMQTVAVLSRLGIQERLDSLPELDTNHIPPTSCLHPTKLALCLTNFYSALFSVNAIYIPQVDQISHRSIRSDARRTLALAVAAAYEKLYEGISSLAVATHTPQQVRALLDI